MKHTKQLRRLAEAKSVGRPYAEYVRNAKGVIMLHPTCTKAIYKRLRKAA